MFFTFTKYWERDLRTLEAARKRVTRLLSDTIRYYEITFCCTHEERHSKLEGRKKAVFVIMIMILCTYKLLKSIKYPLLLWQQRIFLQGNVHASCIIIISL